MARTVQTDREGDDTLPGDLRDGCLFGRQARRQPPKSGYVLRGVAALARDIGEVAVAMRVHRDAGIYGATVVALVVADDAGAPGVATIVAAG